MFTLQKLNMEEIIFIKLHSLTGGFFGSSSWTFGIDGTMVDPMYYEDREMFDSFTDDFIMVQIM